MPVGHMQLICGGGARGTGGGRGGCFELSARERAFENNIPSRGPLPLKKQPLSKNPIHGHPLRRPPTAVMQQLRSPRSWKNNDDKEGKNSGAREKEKKERATCCCCFFFLLCFSSYRDPPACGVETVPQLREDPPKRLGVAWLRPSSPSRPLLLDFSSRRCVRPSVGSTLPVSV